MGCETYPDKLLYKTCLVCGEPTQRLSNGNPMDEEEALSKLRHHEFEKFYAKHCANRGVEADGPLPDEPRQLATENG
jgi:hypothetical protein